MKVTTLVFKPDVQVEGAVGLDGGAVCLTEIEGHRWTRTLKMGSWAAANVATAVNKELLLHDLVGDEGATAYKLTGCSRLYELTLVFPSWPAEQRGRRCLALSPKCRW